jgi:hypothetical protein
MYNPLIYNRGLFPVAEIIVERFVGMPKSLAGCGKTKFFEGDGLQAVSK